MQQMSTATCFENTLSDIERAFLHQVNQECNMKTVLLFAVAAILPTFVGCAYLTPPIEHPIIEQHAQNRVNSFAVIPSRRIMLVKHDDADKKDGKKLVICAEAPADVTDNLASTLAASLSVSGKAANASAAVEKTLETYGQFLFKRTQGIQLFRDRSYHLCQARMNGFINDQQYLTATEALLSAVIPLIKDELQYLDKTQPTNPAQAQRAPSSREVSATSGETTKATVKKP
jgi:hypothetical protein